MLLKPEEPRRDPDKLYTDFYSGETDYYNVVHYYTTDSLNTRLRRKVARVTITLLDGRRFKAKRVRITTDSLYYEARDGAQALPLGAIQKLVVLAPINPGGLTEQVLVHAFLFAVGGGGSALTGPDTDDIGTVARYTGIGALIGVPYGLLIGYGYRGREVILINGYSMKH